MAAGGNHGVDVACRIRTGNRSLAPQGPARTKYSRRRWAMRCNTCGMDLKPDPRPADPTPPTPSGAAPEQPAFPLPPASAPGTERRSGLDRRRVNLGTPNGIRERRVTLEPRKAEVEEVTLSASDWMRFDAAVPLEPKA
jgi:hypothetical protein